MPEVPDRTSRMESLGKDGRPSKSPCLGGLTKLAKGRLMGKMGNDRRNGESGKIGVL